MADWSTRIVDQGEAKVSDLLDHPDNWRKHSRTQKQAVTKVLDRVGWVQGVIVNRKTKRIVDGHLRVELARTRGEENVPVSYVDLSEDEERLVLATLDPLAAMAARDDAAVRRLVSELGSSDEEDLRLLFGEAKGKKVQTETDESVAEATQRIADVPLRFHHPTVKEVKCPKCGYEFAAEVYGV